MTAETESLAPLDGGCGSTSPITPRRCVAALAVMCAVVGFAAGCAGGPRPELVPREQESAAEVAAALPAAPPAADITSVAQSTDFHPTETDALSQWAQRSAVGFTGDCLIGQIPNGGALCGFERTDEIWIMGKGANQGWYVVELENGTAGFRVVATYLAGS